MLPIEPEILQLLTIQDTINKDLQKRIVEATCQLAVLQGVLKVMLSVAVPEMRLAVKSYLQAGVDHAEASMPDDPVTAAFVEATKEAAEAFG